MTRNRLRASCIVSVDAPCVRPLVCRSRYAAPTARTRFTPQLLSKLLSSIEMIASRSTGGNAAYGTTTRRSRANDPNTRPCTSSSSVVVFGRYLARSSICGRSIEYTRSRPHKAPKTDESPSRIRKVDRASSRLPGSRDSTHRSLRFSRSSSTNPSGRTLGSSAPGLDRLPTALHNTRAYRSDPVLGALRPPSPSAHPKPWSAARRQSRWA